MTTLYRYHDYATETGSMIYMHRFNVLRTTPCGVWILHEGRERWVSNTSRKRFAHPTKEEALEGFKARKRRQLSILRNQIAQVKRALETVEHLDESLETYVGERGILH